MYTLSQKVVAGFRWNLVDRLGMWQGLIDSTLVKLESGSGYENYLIFKVILHHWEIGTKTMWYCTEWYFKNVVGLICCHPFQFIIMQSGETGIHWDTECSQTMGVLRHPFLLLLLANNNIKCQCGLSQRNSNRQIYKWSHDSF